MFKMRFLVIPMRARCAPSPRLSRAFVLALAALPPLLLSACGGSTGGSQPAATATVSARTEGTVYCATKSSGQSLATPGTSPGTLVALDGARGTQLWSVALKGSAGLAASASAVYAAVGGKPALQAYRAGDGNLLWQTPANSVPLALSQDTVYVTKAPLNTSSISSTLVALSVTDGSPRWSVDLADTYAVTYAAQEGGMLYTVELAQDPHTGQATQMNLAGREASSGKRVWLVSLPLSQPYGFFAVLNGTVYYAQQSLVIGPGSSNLTVIALRGSDGSMLWSDSFPSSDADGLAVTGAGVYVGITIATSTSLVALAVTSGKQAWVVPVSATPLGIGELTASQSAIYGVSIPQGTSGSSSTVAAYAPVDGRVQWSHAVAEGYPNGLQLVGTKLYLSVEQQTTQAAYVEALNSADGSLAWKQQRDGALITSIVAAPAA